MSTYVLVHGAWHDGSLWAPVAAAIRDEGHEVHTPTLAGNGHGDDIDRTIGHADATRSAIDYIERNDLEGFVLVGHSYGGTIISAVAEAMGERIRRLVYWNAFVLLDGESIDDVSPPHYKDMLDGVTAERGDGSCVLPFPVWREAFCNDMPLPEAERTYALTSPHPRKTLSDKVSLKRFFDLNIAKSYLNCTEDIAMPHGDFAWHPRFSARLGLARIVQMPGGHEALFSNPTLLAAKIIEAGRD